MVDIVDSTAISKDTVTKHDGKLKCNNCECWRVPEDFIGVKGGVVKRCIKCREKDSKQKKKPDTVIKRNERQREKQYYKEHREKKREENEEEFLKHNAEVQKAWRERNKEHLSHWRTTNINCRLRGMKNGAQSRDIQWCESMTK